jgi:hypothetical protein
MSRRKHLVVKDFARIMYKHDPMRLKSPDETEYDFFAVSVLARFLESGEIVSDESFNKAQTIVCDVANLLFSEELNMSDDDLSAFIGELLTTYNDSYDKKKKRGKGTVK